MPSLLEAGHGVSAVTAFAKFLRELQARAQIVKPIASIEPELDKADFQDLLSGIVDVLPGYYETNTSEGTSDPKKGRRFAIIETAVRDAFSALIASIPIESPKFVRVWNLLDIVFILANGDHCDPSLVFWLAEELLDGQTISGCRQVFEFLESRWEWMNPNSTSQKLVILRACNDLLRRLSKAEDAAFCGRIFIYMFQVFPLGDKSSVNLRGEYHVENVTTFDAPPATTEEKMDVDTPNNNVNGTADPKSSKAVSDSKKALEPDALYPLFWGLQTSFSQPKRLFEPAHLAEFKKSLEATMNSFRSRLVPAQQRSSKADSQKNEKSTEEPRKSLKRKRDDEGGFDNLVNGFNPKYLTSRDLFELEISDPSFRRHVLVQALIVMDLLLSLSTKSKEKVANLKTPNRAVLYLDTVLSDEDTKWAAEMKKSIADYLRTGPDGPYFLRMVETVLSRDKNWVRWKSDSCPAIEKPAVSAFDFKQAMENTQSMAMSKKRKTPMGSLNTGFLNETLDGAMDRYQDPERYGLPELASFRTKIAAEDFEIEMPDSDQSKAAAMETKASKTWRALRLASKTKLTVFDKIDNDDKVDVLFEEEKKEPEGEMEGEMEGATDGGDGGDGAEAQGEAVNS